MPDRADWLAKGVSLIAQRKCAALARVLGEVAVIAGAGIAAGIVRVLRSRGSLAATFRTSTFPVPCRSSAPLRCWWRQQSSRR
jgi:hypothetical protein